MLFCFFREREVLVSYLRSVGKTFHESKRQILSSSSSDFTLPDLILPEDILGMENIPFSSEMKVCQVRGRFIVFLLYLNTNIQ